MVKYTKKKSLIRKDRKTVLWFIVVFVLWFIVDYGTVYIAANIENPNHRGIQCPPDNQFKTLPDVVHDKIPAGKTWLTHVANYGVISFGLLLVFCAIARFMWPATRIPTLQCVTFAAIIAIILIILRTITFSVTRLPPTTKGCHTKTTSLIWKPLELIKDETTPGTICVDYMFSAHGMYATLCFLMVCFSFLGGKVFNSTLARVVMGLILIFVLFSITASRLHYTSDVIVAVLVTSLTFFLGRKTVPNWCVSN